MWSHYTAKDYLDYDWLAMTIFSLMILPSGGRFFVPSHFNALHRRPVPVINGASCVERLLCGVVLRPFGPVFISPSTARCAFVTVARRREQSDPCCPLYRVCAGGDAAKRPAAEARTADASREGAAAALVGPVSGEGAAALASPGAHGGC